MRICCYLVSIPFINSFDCETAWSNLMMSISLSSIFFALSKRRFYRSCFLRRVQEPRPMTPMTFKVVTLNFWSWQITLTMSRMCLCLKFSFIIAFSDLLDDSLRIYISDYGDLIRLMKRFSMSSVLKMLIEI